MARVAHLSVAVAVAAAVLVIVGACAAAPTTPVRRTPLEPTPTPQSTPQSTAAAIEDDVVRETTKTAAEQLECPAEQLVVTCTKRDVHGGCIAIQAKGCGKVLDYDFGNE